MRLVPWLMPLALLAACGEAAEPAETAAPADQASVGDIVIEDAAASQEPLPEGFTLPAGTQIASNQQVTAPGGEGRIVLLDSSATPEELEGHFLAEAEAAGFEVTVGTNTSGYRQLAGRRPDGMQFDFAATDAGQGVTRASLAIGRETHN